MFKVDDYIICGGNGVCKVMHIGVPNINMANNKRQYYKLQPIYENMSVVYIPIDNEKIFMRKIISKEEANDIMSNIKSIQVLSFENYNVREDKYKEVMHTYDCKELIRIIKTSYLKKEERLAEGKKNTAADNKYLKIAEDYLFGELSISLDRPKEEIENFIVESVK